MTHEVEILKTKLQTTRQEIRLRAADVSRISTRLALDPSKLSAEEEGILEQARELTILVRQMLALDASIKELSETL